MANNRLYIVNTETKEYACIAKCADGYSWYYGNIDIYQQFINEIAGENPKIIIGLENDDDFYNAHIKDGINLNKTNKFQ